MISLLQRIDLNLVSMILLICVHCFANRLLDKNDKLNRQFLDISLIIIFQLALESVTCILNRRPYQWLIPAAVITNDILFIVGPLLAYCYYCFVYNWVFPGRLAKTSKNLLLLLPLMVNAVFCLITPFTGQIFRVTQDNVYQRGPLVFIPVAVTYFYLLVSFCFIVRHKNSIRKPHFLPLLLFGVFPAIGGAIQMMFYGIILMWSIAALCFVMIFFYIQQRMMQLDPLTGAWTKGSFDIYLEELASRGEKGDRFGAIFIDLDNFKQINDTYGHMEGDAALRNAVLLIKKSIRKSDIVARFGGDEFVITVHNTNRKETEEVLARLAKNFSEFNFAGKSPYPLEYSVGYGVYDPKEGDVWQFINYVDHMMYQNKNRRRHPAARDGTEPQMSSADDREI